MKKVDLDVEQKKLIARWKAIDNGKVKLHCYKNLTEFDRALC